MTRDKAIAELIRIWHSPHLDLSLKAGLAEAIDALKENNQSDSLVTDSSDACKESESKLDLISRERDTTSTSMKERLLMDDSLIRRSDAIDAVTRAIWHYPNECYKNLNVYEVAEALVSDAIKSLPSRLTEYKTFCGVPIEEAARIVQEHNAEPKTGEWIDYSDEGYVECPFCHSATNCEGNKDELHYCFSCGADMRGGKDDERS